MEDTGRTSASRTRGGRTAKTLAYLAALDEIEVKMAERYLRSEIRRHGITVLSTQTADEVNIAYLAGDVMGVAPAAVVGQAFAPPEDNPSERDLAWFFKLSRCARRTAASSECASSPSCRRRTRTNRSNERGVGLPRTK
jgi:hypothetical protein